MPIQIPLLNKGTVVDYVVVSDEDADLLSFRWGVSPKRYAVRHQRVAGIFKTIMMHRMILERMLGRELLPSPKEQVDHIDRNPSNNRRDNLRLTNDSLNNLNKTKLRSRAGNAPYSNYKGVTWWESRGRGKWLSQVSIGEGKQVKQGYYEDEETAARAYDRYVCATFGAQLAVLNFVMEHGPNICNCSSRLSEIARQKNEAVTCFESLQQRVVAAYNAGETSRLIAEREGITEALVDYYRVKAGARPKGEVRRERILDMASKGMSRKEIAEQLGMRRDALDAWFGRENKKVAS